MPPDLPSYDHIVVATSGGKDSVACILALLEAGAPRERIILIHHEVDGREGSTLMDWPSTKPYVEALVAHLGVDVIWSWRVGGIEGEMLRKNTPTGAVRYEHDAEIIHLPGAPNAPKGVRLKFPQVSADLSVRWCSQSSKIDVADRVLRNDPMFAGAKTLFVTGERGEESPNRARYAEFERHRADRRDGVEGGISSRKGGNSRKMGGITLKLGPTVYVFTVNSYLTVAS